MFKRFSKELKEAKEKSLTKWNTDVYRIIHHTDSHPCALCQLFPNRKGGICYTKDEKQRCPLSELGTPCCKEWSNVRTAVERLMHKLNSI